MSHIHIITDKHTSFIHSARVWNGARGCVGGEAVTPHAQHSFPCLILNVTCTTQFI